MSINKYIKKSYIEIPFFLLRMVIIIFLAIKWAAFNDMFTIKNVEINGIKIVGETDILNTVKHAATKLYSENVRNLIELYIAVSYTHLTLPTILLV